MPLVARRVVSAWMECGISCERRREAVAGEEGRGGWVPYCVSVFTFWWFGGAGVGV